MKIFRMLTRSIRDAFKSVFRNFSLSLASISCISVTLVIVALSFLISLNVNNIANVIKDDVTIVAFVKSDATEEEITQIRNRITRLDNIASIEFKSKEDFKQQIEESSNILATITKSWDDNENPLKCAFEVKVKKLEEINLTAEQIENTTGIDTIDYGETFVNRMISIFKMLEKGTIIAVVALLVVTVFLIINTIKLTIFSRKREISIMRLVGASNTTIKLPFVVEGMILGLIGSLIPIILIIYGYFAFYKDFDGQIYSPLFKLIKPEPFIYQLSLIILLIGVFVGMIGSYRAVKKYLKV